MKRSFTLYRVTPRFLKGIVKRCKAYINVIYVEDCWRCWSVFFEGGDEFGRDSTHVPNQLGSTLQWLQVEETMWVCAKILCIYGGFLKWWYPQNTSKWSFLVGKPMVVGYHHFRKPSYIYIYIMNIPFLDTASACFVYHCFTYFRAATSHEQSFVWRSKGPTPLIPSSDQGRSSDFRQTPPKLNSEFTPEKSIYGWKIRLSKKGWPTYRDYMSLQKI